VNLVNLETPKAQTPEPQASVSFRAAPSGQTGQLGGDLETLAVLTWQQSSCQGRISRSIRSTVLGGVDSTRRMPTVTLSFPRLDRPAFHAGKAYALEGTP